MKKIIKNILLFISSIATALITGVLLYLYIPNSFYNFFDLKRSEATITRKQRVLDKSIAIFGGCEPGGFPLQCIKIRAPVSDSIRIIELVNTSKLPPECENIVVAAGIYLAALDYPLDYIHQDNAKIAAALRKKYPDKAVNVIPIEAQLNLLRRSKYCKNNWHLNKRGYKALYQQYQQYFASPSNHNRIR